MTAAAQAAQDRVHEVDDNTDHAAPMDLLLTDAALGPLRRLVPGVSGLRFAANLAKRPGAVLGRGSKAGAYVEIKASEIGAGSKVPHLAYVGDAVVGERSNVGAGTIVVNYDGRDKHRTTVGDDVRVGSDSMLVAPLTIGDGAYTAAGSVITQDVPAGSLGVGRARQRNIEGWVARMRRAPAADHSDDSQGTAP